MKTRDKYKNGINGENWHLVSPEGKHYIFYCLRDWLRQEGSAFFNLDEYNYFHTLKLKTKRGLDCDYKGWKIILDTKKIRKSPSPHRHIEVGKTYGGIKVLGIANEKNPRKYACACIKCGAQSEMKTQEIFQNTKGCINCYLEKRSRKFQEKAESHIGEKHGTLTIFDVFLTYRKDPKLTIWGAKCKCDCGDVADYILCDVVTGFVRCQKCNAPSNFVRTNILKRAKKYYVSISYSYLDRHLFSIGNYDSLEESLKVQQEAKSQKAEGTFIEWYKTNFPISWERIKKNIAKRNGSILYDSATEKVIGFTVDSTSLILKYDKVVDGIKKADFLCERQQIKDIIRYKITF